MIAGGHYAKNASQEGTYCLLYYFDPNIYIFKLYRIFINQAILICNESTNYNFYLEAIVYKLFTDAVEIYGGFPFSPCRASVFVLLVCVAPPWSASYEDLVGN